MHGAQQVPVLAVGLSLGIVIMEVALDDGASPTSPNITCRTAHAPRAHLAPISGFEFDSGASQLYSSALDGIIRLWSVTGRRLTEGEAPSEELRIELERIVRKGNFEQGVYGLAMSTNSVLMAYLCERLPSTKLKMYEARKRTTLFHIQRAAFFEPDTDDAALTKSLLSRLHSLSEQGRPLELWDMVELLNSQSSTVVFESIIRDLEGKYYAIPRTGGNEFAHIRLLRIANALYRGVKKVAPSEELQKKERQNTMEIFLAHVCACLTRFLTKATDTRIPMDNMPNMEEQKCALIQADWLALQASAETSSIARRVYELVGTAEDTERLVTLTWSSGSSTILGPSREECPFCNEPVAISSALVETCPKSHPLWRCRLSLQLVTTCEVLHCPICDGNALPLVSCGDQSSSCPFDWLVADRTSSCILCPLCEVPLVHFL